MTLKNSPQIPPKIIKYAEHIYRHAIEIWQHWSVWVIGPILIGLMAVGLAMGSNFMSDLNTRLVQLHPYAPLFFMPPGFALLAYLGARFFSGAM